MRTKPSPSVYHLTKPDGAPRLFGDQAGVSLLAVFGFLIVASIGAVAVNIALQNENKLLTNEKVTGTASAGNQSALALYEKLFTYDSGPSPTTPLPAIFLDPYIASPGKPIAVRATGATTSGPNWSIDGAGVATVQVPFVRELTPTQLQNLYANSQQPPADAVYDQKAAITFVSADPSGDTVNYPYLVPSIVVQVQSTTRSDGQVVVGKTVKNTARITIPPPPAPKCNIVLNPSAGPIPPGSSVVAQLFGTGVIVSANLSDTTNPAINFTSPAGTLPPTPGTKINATVPLGSWTFTAVNHNPGPSAPDIFTAKGTISGASVNSPIYCYNTLVIAPNAATPSSPSTPTSPSPGPGPLPTTPSPTTTPTPGTPCPKDTVTNKTLALAVVHDTVGSCKPCKWSAMESASFTIPTGVSSIKGSITQVLVDDNNARLSLNGVSVFAQNQPFTQFSKFSSFNGNVDISPQLRAGPNTFTGKAYDADGVFRFIHLTFDYSYTTTTYVPKNGFGCPPR